MRAQFIIDYAVPIKFLRNFPSITCTVDEGGLDVCCLIILKSSLGRFLALSSASQEKDVFSFLMCFLYFLRSDLS